MEYVNHRLTKKKKHVTYTGTTNYPMRQVHAEAGVRLSRLLLLFIGFLWSLILLTSDEQETVQNLKINSSSLISCAVNSSSYHYVQTIPSSTLRVDASRHLQTSAMFPVCMCKYDPMRESTTSVRVNSTLGSMPLPIASDLVPNYASQTTTARLLRLLSRE